MLDEMQTRKAHGLSDVSLESIAISWKHKFKLWRSYVSEI